MTVYNLLLFAHVMLLVYWLGSDIGVFYGMRFVLNPNLSLETRKTVMQLLHWIDLFPRICLVMMVPVGISLSFSLGLIEVPEQSRSMLLVLIWLVALFWLFLVLRIYGGARGWFIRVDYTIRISVMLGFAITGLLSLAGKGPVMAGTDWLAIKALLFAAIIACGLGLRILGKPFGEALGQILAGQTSPQTEQRLNSAMTQSKRIVVLLWLLVAIAAYMGLTKPY